MKLDRTCSKGSDFQPGHSLSENKELPKFKSMNFRVSYCLNDRISLHVGPQTVLSSLAPTFQVSFVKLSIRMAGFHFLLEQCHVFERSPEILSPSSTRRSKYTLVDCAR